MIQETQRPQDILKKYSSQKIDGATYYLHGHVLRAMMEYAKYAVERVNCTQSVYDDFDTKDDLYVDGYDGDGDM